MTTSKKNGAQPGPRTSSVLRAPVRADRVRSIREGQGFAFIPNRFLRDGFFASLESNEQRLYLLLVLAADRRGQSYYHYDSICSLLEVTLDEYVEARNGLLEKDLIAFDGTRFQVLSLPATVTQSRATRHDPLATPRSPEIRAQILAALQRDD
jgi:hypothetical protein